MNKLACNAVWGLILVIGIEATVRKYFVASPIVVLFKYVFICFLIYRLFQLNRSSFVILLFASSLPLLLTVRSIEHIPYAIYDYLGLVIVPMFVVIAFLSSKTPTFVKPTMVLKTIAFIGLLNSILVVIQFFVGPNHWLSATVDQQFSQHVYGEFQKAPGLAGVSSPFLSVAGLASLLAIMNMEQKAATTVYLLGSIILIAPLFNLSSRSYFFGVFLYSFLWILTSTLRKGNYYRIMQITVLVVGAFILYSALSEYIMEFDFIANSRTFADFSSASSRMAGQSLVNVMNLDLSELPPLFGLGLGYTVNNNPYADLTNLPFYCSQFDSGAEGEFERLICSFGVYGFFSVILRATLAFVIIFQVRRKDISSLPHLSALYLYSGFLILNGLQLKQNDNVVGLVLIGIVVLLAKSSLKNQVISSKMV